jgi:hypothetical protein
MWTMAALTVVIGVALGRCEAPPEDVATMRTVAPEVLEGTASSTAGEGNDPMPEGTVSGDRPETNEPEQPEAPSQLEAAEAFYSCLVYAGMPGLIEDQGNSSAIVSFDSTQPLYWGLPGAAKAPSAANLMWRVHEDLTLERIKEFEEEDPETYRLWIGGTDRTETLEQSQRIVDATNTGIVCAREHGRPELEDARVPETTSSDPFAVEYPRVYLPLSMTKARRKPADTRP